MVALYLEYFLQRWLQFPSFKKKNELEIDLLQQINIPLHLQMNLWSTRVHAHNLYFLNTAITRRNNSKYLYVAQQSQRF